MDPRGDSAGGGGAEDDSAEDAAGIAWSLSGMASLCGHGYGPPLGTPLTLVAEARRLATQIELLSARHGKGVALDPLALMAERAGLVGLTRGGSTSCGRGTRMMEAADGWTALTLGRTEDWELLAALFGLESAVTPGD
jgi:hypothetical protein